MFIEISPRAAKVCGGVLRFSPLISQIGFVMSYASLSHTGPSVGEHRRIHAVVCVFSTIKSKKEIQHAVYNSMDSPVLTHIIASKHDLFVLFFSIYILIATIFDIIINLLLTSIQRLSEITASSEESQHLRVTVTSGGCHGFQYLMSLEPSTKVDEAEDTIFEPSETDGNSDSGHARVVMDQPSLELLSGSTVDFTTELIGSQFKVNNPKATSNCGCGTSFDINL
jgi:iron-sulfur cluster assembly accessory protein